MTIRIDRGRQFQMGEASVQVFDGAGKAGSFLQKAAEKLAAEKTAAEKDPEVKPASATLDPEQKPASEVKPAAATESTEGK